MKAASELGVKKLRENFAEEWTYVNGQWTLWRVFSRENFVLIEIKILVTFIFSE